MKVPKHTEIVPPCICDDPHSKPWQRQACRRRGCTKQLFIRGPKSHPDLSKEELRRARNQRHRQKLANEESSSASTATTRGSPAKLHEKFANPLLTESNKKTQRGKGELLSSKFKASERRRKKAFLYLKDKAAQGNPHGLTEELFKICWRCVAEEERLQTPPYNHADWCRRRHYEDQREGGPNDPYKYEGYLYTNTKN